MLIDLAAISFGLILLIWSSGRFVSGASATAANLEISPLVIGLTIVGFGTSAPELVVATFASIGGNPGLAVGNALGSNITNIALVLGIAAIVVPIRVHSRILRKELPILIAATLLATALLSDHHLGIFDGIVLLGSQIVLLIWVIRQARQKSGDELATELALEIPQKMSMGKSVFLLLVGLIVLVASSRLLVWGAVNIATELGISDLVIGLTIIAIGTSLPELATSITAMLKNEHDLVIGNVVGSNLFNTLAVLSVGGLLQPSPLAALALERDMLIVCILTLLLFLLAYGFRRHPAQITRHEGGLLLLIFIAYESVIYINTTGLWSWPISI